MTESSGDDRIEMAKALFAAWSSGDVDAPAQYMHTDATLYDIPGGEYKGWPAIREFFSRGLEKWPDLELIPEEFWTNEHGIALSWVMSATVPDDRLGESARGRRWRSEGMTHLVFEDGKIRREVDYHDSGAAPRSLGLTS